MDIKLKITYENQFELQSTNNNQEIEIINEFKNHLKNKESSLYRTIQMIYLKIFEQSFNDLIDEDEQYEPFYIDYNGRLQLVIENDQFNLYIETQIPNINQNQFFIDAVDIYTEKSELLTTIGEFSVDYKGILFNLSVKTFIKQINFIVRFFVQIF